MYESTTRDVRIEVEPHYVREQSKPNQGYYLFAYKVKIQNRGKVAVTLIGRHWIITDGLGQTEEVVGEGVIGQQPTLAPGEEFEYTSYCPLATPTGSMHGRYQMVSANGEKWEVTIPQFILADPSQFH